MKKILSLALAVLMLFSVTSFAAAENHEPVTLEFVCWGAAETTTAPAFNAMIEGFMAKYPWITVEVTESNYDGVNTSLQNRCAVEDYPDVAQVSNQWVAALYDLDGLLPLEDLFDAETIADFYTGSMEGTIINGKHYSAAWIMQPFGLYCNMDLLAAAGYDHVPATWAEFIQMAYDVAKLGTTRVFVLGEVKNQGMYELTKSHRVLDALGAAGGFTEKAAKKNIFLVRNRGTAEENVQKLNILNYMKKGDLSQNLVLHEGDCLFLTSNHKVTLADALLFVSRITDAWSDAKYIKNN